ncbi:hypothetical protein D043_4153A, partial [Vibrio parahaemolyticus EKP-021]
MNMRTVRR